MTPFVVILIATPVVFWLLRRRHRSHNAELRLDEAADSIQAPDDTPAPISALPIHQAASTQPGQTFEPPIQTAHERQDASVPLERSIDVAGLDARYYGIEKLEVTNELSAGPELTTVSNARGLATARMGIEPGPGLKEYTGIGEEEDTEPRPSRLPDATCSANPPENYLSPERSSRITPEQKSAATAEARADGHARLISNGDSCLPEDISGQTTLAPAIAAVPSSDDLSEIVEVLDGHETELTAPVQSAKPAVSTEPIERDEQSEMHGISGSQVENSSAALLSGDETTFAETPTNASNEITERSANEQATSLEDIQVSAPRRYRPPAKRQQRRHPAASDGISAPRNARNGATLDILVRLTLDRFDFCEISFLPERKADMDDEIAVKSEGARYVLAALDDWYGDVYFENTGERLTRGIRLAGLLANGRRVQWNLSSGRTIHVLASHPRASGFVTVPRLVLGRSHVVLCANSVLEHAEEILKQAGCDGYTKLQSDNGIPTGWTGLHGVLPKTALTLGGIDEFYALKPAPDIGIELEGGLLLHDSAWLAGYPPKITLTGQTNSGVKVLIDGKEAEPKDGCYSVDGFDAPGQHLVECDTLTCSRSYSIEEPEESWEQWPAYEISGAGFCGPLVTVRPEARNSRLFTVPMTNPRLVGAEPGQLFYCSRRNAARWQGFVPFEVVWALPAQPLICDKKTSQILRFSSTPVAAPNANRHLSLGWCSAILDAGRKGLRIEASDPEAAAQWTEYKRIARKIWRSKR